MSHVHVSKVLKWGMNAELRFTAVQYGCTDCDVVSDVPLESATQESAHDAHDAYVEGCFGCKARTLQLNPGDALSGRIMPQGKWDNELAAYRAARAQGVQPAGTKLHQVQEALDASERLGRAYDGGTMPAAPRVTKEVASVMNELKV